MTVARSTAPYQIRPVTGRRPGRTTVLAVVLAVLAALLAAAVGPAAPAAAAPGGPTDVIFSLDGSGSIDDTDWSLQRNSYAAALLDTTAFPRDGSIAVGVVQWSSSVQLEAPLRVIRDENDVAALRATILGLDQLANSTNPGDGLRFSADQLAGSGRPDPATWSVCMSTDGTTNSGESLGSAVAHAQSVGVDRYSVIGIEDFGNGADLAAHYGPAVFGGGTFSLARNTAEFASLIIGGCLNDPVEVVALEVTQAVQNWQNDVALVAAKPTVVRAFVQVPAGEDDQRVNGRLIGRRGGAELPGSPLSATNPGGSVLASTDVADRRGVLGDSLNFLLPPSWRSGTVELELDGGGTGLDCMEVAGPTPEDCSVTVTFEAGTEVGLRVVGVPYTAGGATVVPTPAALAETGRRVATTFPASRLDVSTQASLLTTFTGAPALAAVNRVLALQRVLDLCFSVLGCTTLYYGQVSGDDDGGLAMGIPGDVSSGYDFDVTGPNQPGFFRNVAPHEVGHTLGLNHSVRGPVANNAKLGPCNEVAAGTAPDFPWFGAVGGSDRSLLGDPAADEDAAIWGFDARFVRADPGGLAVVAPEGAQATFDLMGYCYLASPQDLWPSDYTYGLLQSGLAARAGTTVTSAFSAKGIANGAPTTSGQHLVFTGRVDLPDGAATIGAPVVVDGELPVPPAGDYTLRLRGSGGAVLAEVPFEVELDGGRPPTTTAPPPPPAGGFMVPVPRPADPVGSVEVLRGTTSIGTLTATPQAPQVAVTAPADGAVIDTDTVTVSWTASDADGGPLTSSVRYTPDDGTTWETLAVDLADTTLTVPRSALTGSTTASVEVQTTDGLNVTTARSGTFTVAGSPPTVDISSPTDGEAFYSGVQQIVLEATAQDNEDGALDQAVTWTSDVDGAVLTGPSGSIGADTLSEGTHVLTASVTDSDGTTGTDSVTIEVVRVAQPPGALPPPEDDDSQVLGVTTSRLAGLERIATALAISQDQWGSTGGSGRQAGAVVLARADGFADALAGTRSRSAGRPRCC